MRNLRGIAAGFTLLLLLAGVAACGGASDGKAAVGKTASPTATSTTGSATPAAASGQVGPALFQSMTSAMSKAQTTSVSFKMSVAGKETTGRGGYRFGTHFGADMTMDLAAMGKARVILVPKAMYMMLPPGSGLSADKPWLKIKTDGSGTDPLSKAMAPMMDQLQQSFDPHSNLRMLSVIPKLTSAGHAPIDGVDTVRYSATIDMATAAAHAQGPLGKQFRAMVEAGLKTMDYSLWVDGKNLPRRVRIVMDLPQGTTTSTYDYLKWGLPLTIKAPPARLVASPHSLAHG
jgi:hypothetical protein